MVFSCTGQADPSFWYTSRTPLHSSIIITQILPVSEHWSYCSPYCIFQSLPSLKTTLKEIFPSKCSRFFFPVSSADCGNTGLPECAFAFFFSRFPFLLFFSRSCSTCLLFNQSCLTVFLIWTFGFPVCFFFTGSPLRVCQVLCSVPAIFFWGFFSFLSAAFWAFLRVSSVSTPPFENGAHDLFPNSFTSPSKPFLYCTLPLFFRFFQLHLLDCCFALPQGFPHHLFCAGGAAPYFRINQVSSFHAFSLTVDLCSKGFLPGRPSLVIFTDFPETGFSSSRTC